MPSENRIEAIAHAAATGSGGGAASVPTHTAT